MQWTNGKTMLPHQVARIYVLRVKVTGSIFLPLYD
jgi:hypothetical protein